MTQLQKFCTSCGNALSPGDRFCQGCGRPLSVQSRAEPKPVEHPPQPIGGKPKRTFPSLIMWVVGLLILVLILGGGYLWQKKQDTRKEAERNFDLGERCYYGFISSPNYQEAAKYMHKAADLGHAKACFYLFSLYGKGKGVKMDPAESLKWLERSADLGYMEAQFILGEFYLEGQEDKPSGVKIEKNQDKAISFFRKAAAQGHPEAQEELKRMGVKP